MKTASALLACGLLAGALAACSGSLGNGGSSAVPFPGSSSSPGIGGAAPTSTPNSATGAASIGSKPVPQPLPTVAGYGGTVTFAAPSPVPTASGSPVPVSVALFTTVVTPNGAPELQEHPKKSLLRRQSQQTATVVHKPLLYVTLNPTTDVTFASFPAFAFDVPASKLDGKTEFGLALYDPTEKVHRFRLDVAPRDEAAAPAPTATPSARGTSLARLSASPSPSASGSPAAAPSATPIPTGRVAFAASPGTFAMRANKTYVFALYAFVPLPSPSPSASASSSAASSASPAATGSATPQSPVPSASAAATASH